MNKFNLDEVYRIALEVRNWAEHLWFQNDGDPDLTGCCVIGAICTLVRCSEISYLDMILIGIKG